jgi:PadR family transcriptional regulator PadR
MTDLTDWQSQLRRGVIELLVLALIDREPTYGYEIVTALEGMPQLAVSEGTVYPLLRRLRKERLLDTFWQESAAGPPRQYYKLTAEGRRYLETLRREWRTASASVDRFLGGGGRRDER